MLHPCACSAAGSPAAPHMHVAAIDNSLAFPHQHPLGWRSFTYGWLFLPLSLIGQPWSASTRQRFLHKLEDPTWWVSLKRELKTEFSKDAAFREEMFERQWAVVKGQGYNLAQSLRASEEGASSSMLLLATEQLRFHSIRTGRAMSTAEDAGL